MTFVGVISTERVWPLVEVVSFDACLGLPPPSRPPSVCSPLTPWGVSLEWDGGHQEAFWQMVRCGFGAAYDSAKDEVREVEDAVKIASLIERFRHRGHLCANLDPLGRVPRGPWMSEVPMKAARYELSWISVGMWNFLTVLMGFNGSPNLLLGCGVWELKSRGFFGLESVFSWKLKGMYLGCLNFAQMHTLACHLGFQEWTCGWLMYCLLVWLMQASKVSSLLTLIWIIP